MENALNEVLEQAFKLVAEVDRRAAQERERLQEAERQARLSAFQAELDQCFDFSSREKIELGTRLESYEEEPALEFMVRNARAVFVLRRDPEQAKTWRLMVQDGNAPNREIGVFVGGSPEWQAFEDGSRRVAAVRVVAAIGRYILGPEAKAPRAAVQEPDRSFRRASFHTDARPDESHASLPRDPMPAQRPNGDVSYGTFGKLFGY